MTDTPPSSPALSEARERAAIEDLLSSLPCDKWCASNEPNNHGDCDCSRLRLIPKVDALMKAAHASGLAAGREQADAEWRKRVEKVASDMDDVPLSETAWSQRYDRRANEVKDDCIEVLAALRSPVGG